MSYAIVTDSTANLNAKQLEENNIIAIPFPYFLNGQEQSWQDLDNFDAKQYYDAIRRGAKVTTSQINPQTYYDHFEPVLKNGQDIFYLCFSSGFWSPAKISFLSG